MLGGIHFHNEFWSYLRNILRPCSLQRRLTIT